MSFASVSSNVHKALDVHLNLAPKVPLHLVFGVDRFADRLDLRFAQVFDRLAEFETSHDELRGYITSSMIYPALLSLVGLGSVIVLMTFVAPRFAAVFEQSRMAIPLPTQVMLTTSKWLQAYGWILAAAVVASAAGDKGIPRTEASASRVFTTKDGSLRFPRKGIGARKGASVSTRIARKGA